MTEALAGRYFYPGSSRYVPARAVAQDGILRVEDESGAVLAHVSFDHVEISPRMGSLRRRFTLLDAGCFETDDNDAADLLLKDRRKGISVHRLERSWRWAGISVVLAAAVVYVFVAYGIPAIALWLARETPSSVAATISSQGLGALEKTVLKPSRLTEADQQKAQALFAGVAAQGQRSASDYRLLIRSAPSLGPNALALPDGTIVMTDQLWPFVKAEDEIEGVFAHEIAHVDHAHSLQALYQAALVPAALAVVTGDISQISQMAAILPGVLVQAAYSRGLEQQADDDAAITVRRLGGNPAHMADLLERLDARLCAKSGCPPNWLGSHPQTTARAQRLRSVGTK
jgi:Zn-dependent protease with chaperone function